MGVNCRCEQGDLLAPPGMQKSRHLLTVRELSGTRAQRSSLPEVRGGVLVLGQVDLAELPIRPLDAYSGTVLHYLDVSGCCANSIADFGGDAATVAGVVKLYAGRCQLKTLRGLERFASLRYVYLEENQLQTLEWFDSQERARSLFDEAPGWHPQQLLNIDLRGNPVGDGLGVDRHLCGLSTLEWLDGTRWTEARRQAGELLAKEEKTRVGAATVEATHADDMREVLQTGLILRRYRHVGLRASASAVHGTGCFATRYFTAGEFVCDYFGRLVPRDSDGPSRGCAEGIFRLNDVHQIEPASCDAPASHTIALRINHGCNPNLMSIATNLRRNLLFTTAEAEMLRLPLHSRLPLHPERAASLATEQAAKKTARAMQTPVPASLDTSQHHSIKRPCFVGRAVLDDPPGTTEPEGGCTPGCAEHDAQHGLGGGGMKKASHDACGDVYDVVCLIALREIRPGEELCFDYGRAEPSAICGCNAVCCRGKY